MNKNESIEKQRKNIKEKIDMGIMPQLLSIESGELLADCAIQRFISEINGRPYFWMSITPTESKANLVDVDNADIRKLILNPPGSRPNGWNVECRVYAIERFADGIRCGDKEFRYLEVLGNGHTEFWTPLNDHFCWRQSSEEFQKRPRLYPYPVNEYPTTFLRLYKEIVNYTSIKCEFLINLQYRNLKGYALQPYAPDAIGFLFSNLEMKSFEDNHLVIPQTKVNYDFEPDRVAYGLIKIVYSLFGFMPRMIPFYKANEGKFYF